MLFVLVDKLRQILKQVSKAKADRCAWGIETLQLCAVLCLCCAMAPCIMLRWPQNGSHRLALPHPPTSPSSCTTLQLVSPCNPTTTHPTPPHPTLSIPSCCRNLQAAMAHTQSAAAVLSEIANARNKGVRELQANAKHFVVQAEVVGLIRDRHAG